MALALQWASCGQALLSGAKEDEKKDEDVDDLQNGDVEFSGYVQKAFTIKVNGVSFSDSENFYTRFIQDLVLPKYENLKGTEVALEGQYGLSEFGKNSKIYMSSVASDGHLFEGTTDTQSKFVIRVKAKALDETFKARVIIRIGLEIKYPAEPTKTSDHYCYILHGNKEGILVSENSKPIIFDDFATQLNTYKCEDVKDSELVIPSAEGGTTGGTTGGGDTPSEPKVEVVATIKVPSPLGEYTGENKLRFVSFDPADNRFLILKDEVVSKTSGERLNPLIFVAGGLEKPNVSSIEFNAKNSSTPVGYDAVVQQGDKLFAAKGTQFDAFDISGQFVVTLMASSGVVAEFTYDQNKLIPLVSDASLKVLSLQKSNNNDGTANLYPKLCVPDLDSAKPCSSIVAEPDSNHVHTNSMITKSAAALGGAIYALVRRGLGGLAIVKFNDALVYQKSYTIPKLTVPDSEFDGLRIAADASSLYLVHLAADELVFRKIELKE